MKITGVGERTANLLYEEGFKNVAMISLAEPEELSSIKGISEKKPPSGLQKQRRLLITKTAKICLKTFKNGSCTTGEAIRSPSNV